MAATRKLQGEIDRCLKKVAEGVETFEDIWKKVHNATNSNQKEKYEADLKKEIKKLQRLRDQIKSWIASAEIKDKSSLLENRRLIETQMERFKIVERETKTKAYSKEGLGAAQKMDPAQRMKDEARNWLTNSISSLQIQIDQFESEIESLLAGKKKRLDRDKQDRMDEFRSKLDRHKFHVTKLETLLRLLDNDGVEAEQVNKIKDDVEYYIDSSQEPDFEENEFLYDDIIGLDEVELSGTATTDSNNSNETSGSPSSITSGGSPINSPPPITQQQLQQQQLQQQQGGINLTQQTTMVSMGSNVSNLNYSLDSMLDGTTVSMTTTAMSTSMSSLTIDKRNKPENANNSIKQPVKPTAVRAASVNKITTSAANDGTTNKIISSTPSKNYYSQQQQQQQQTLTTPSALATSAGSISTSIGSVVSNSPGSLAAAVAAVGHNPTVQQHAPAPSLNTTAAIGAAVSTTTTITTTQQQQQPPPSSSSATNAANISNIQGQSVIQAPPTIAFAAVAKNNSTSHLENGPTTHSVAVSQYAMTSPTMVAIVNTSAQQQQQQQQQLPNLQTNSSHLQSATHNTSSSTANSLATSNVASVNTGSLANCISPNSMAGLTQVIGGGGAQQQSLTNNLTRASPGLLSPKHINGLTAVANNNAVDGISLKTMAQKAINRSVIDNNSPQQQQQMLQQHFSAESTTATPQQQQQLQQQQKQQQHPNTTGTIVTNGPTTAAGNSGVAGGTVGAGVVALSSLTNSSGGVGGQTSTSNGTTTVSVQQPQQPTNEAHIPPLLGVAPLGPSPLHKDHQYQFQMMEAAYYHLPTPSDSEKLTTYFHRTPVQTPIHYPQSPLPIYDTVEFYQRLSTETLFFVFYYMEGSKAQYLAAKALKKQSWRFHTKYMMWFQRHEEPKIINDDYEQGTYIYFDYEKWSQRKKEGFTFEYKYLEDKELN